MNLDKKLVIISNEKTSIRENRFYCDAIDMKSIPEGFSKSFEVLLISRKKNIESSHQINIK